MPRSRSPTLSPAWPWSSSLRNISTPVQVVFLFGRMPTISISSPTLTTPRSMRPVATVPRPEIEKTSSTGIRNGWSTGRSGVGMYVVDRGEELAHRLLADLRVAVLERRQRRAGDDRDVVAGEVVGGEQLAHLELDELQQLGVVDLVDLVEEHHHRRHADLLGQQDVLAGLRHRAVGGGDHQDRAVHLRRAGDHVLHVVGVAGAVDVGIVPRRRSRTPRARSRW